MGASGELFDVVALLSSQPVPAGRRVAVVTNAGGPGILLADACEAHGLALPALAPAFVASGAIAFATAMGAFGTAFTLATNIDVLPMLIYTEFTLAANFATAAALSVGLGVITWFILMLARSFSGGTVAAAG